VGGSAGTSAAGAANVAGGGEAGSATSNCTGNVLFVVGSEPLTRGDSAILDRLRGLGFVVSIIAASMVTADSAAGSDFALISRSVRSPDVMAPLRDQPVPLFVTEYNLYSSLGMTADATAASGGDTLTSTDLSIVDPTHPLAAGFSGTVTVLEPGKGQYGFGVPGGDAVVVANLVDEPQGAAIFAYERGSAMVGLLAPARRVGYFLDIQASTRLTVEGWALFDAAAQWTAGPCATR
ncbi:MAG TPA: hypothetical protein VNG33_11015, partial [Polyangiaceae bacterium]|nr:hypothetical protein [Polyangiaceae bacterium]